MLSQSLFKASEVLIGQNQDHGERVFVVQTQGVGRKFGIVVALKCLRHEHHFDLNIRFRIHMEDIFFGQLWVKLDVPFSFGEVKKDIMML